MARWEPHAPQRLAEAALELFAERGYDDTTVLDIAQRAGLAKSTFFRHFQNKRDVLFGEDALTEQLVTAISEAPAEATPSKRWHTGSTRSDGTSSHPLGVRSASGGER